MHLYISAFSPDSKETRRNSFLDFCNATHLPEVKEVAMLYDLGTLNLRELAEHLGGIDTRTARTLARATGIDIPRVRHGAPAYIAWLDVFRKIHRIEPMRHADILPELKEQLVPLRVLAQHMGTTAEALKKRVQRGRITLPPPVTVETHRLWRPRDLRLWQVGEPVPTYATPVVPAQASERPAPSPVSRGARTATVLGLGGAPSIAQIRDKASSGPTPPS